MSVAARVYEIFAMRERYPKRSVGAIGGYNHIPLNPPSKGDFKTSGERNVGHRSEENDGATSDGTEYLTFQVVFNVT